MQGSNLLIPTHISNTLLLYYYHVSPHLRLTRDPHNDQIPVGLTAQLVEHCTGIAEVRVQIPGQAFLAAALISSAKTGMNHTTKNSFQHAFQIKEFHEFTAHK